jgi:hypothetical protein
MSVAIFSNGADYYIGASRPGSWLRDIWLAAQ